MKALLIFALTALTLLSGCSHSQNTSQPAMVTTKGEQQTESRGGRAAEVNDSLANRPAVSPSSQSGTTLPSESERKIIRTADLSFEVKSTQDAVSKLMSMAETRGGFVVASESKQRNNDDSSQRTMDVKLTIRVPAEHFGAVIDEMKSLATNVTADSRIGQDVTEEFMDIEARLKTQKALELQFLEIMKQAKTVSDALEVQRQIADVRTEIEKIEGRKRFIENRAALATITINLSTPAAIGVSPTGFGRNLREAVADALEVANALLLFFVRFVIVMIPITLFIFLPLWLILRYLIRRARRMRLARTLVTPVAEPSA